MFGNETPFYLKPLPNRGLRCLDAEAQQHYPNYRHPLDYTNPTPTTTTTAMMTSAAAKGGDAPQTSTPRAAAAVVAPGGRAMPGTSGTGYRKATQPFNPVYNITEAERVHPTLSPTDRLRYERDEAKAKNAGREETRRCRAAERERFFVQRQEEARRQAETKAALMAGTALKNVESEGRDTITHACFTVEAQREKDYRDAAGKYAYFARQKLVSEHDNTSGYNILTWEPRKAVEVPPMPKRVTEATQQTSSSHPQLAHEVNIESFE